MPFDLCFPINLLSLSPCYNIRIPNFPPRPPLPPLQLFTPPTETHSWTSPHLLLSWLWFMTSRWESLPWFLRGRRPSKQRGASVTATGATAPNADPGSPNTGQVSRRWKCFPLTLPKPHFKRQWVMTVMFITEHMFPHMSHFGGGRVPLGSACSPVQSLISGRKVGDVGGTVHCRSRSSLLRNCSIMLPI